MSTEPENANLTPEQREALEELERAAGGAPALEGDVLRPGEGPSPGDYEPEFDLDELAADTLELALEAFAPNWLSDELPEKVRITRPKIEKLSKGYVALAVHYLPGFLAKYPLVAAVVIQTGVTILPIIKNRVPRFVASDE